MDAERLLSLLGVLFGLFASAFGQVSVSSSAAASVKYNKGMPQAYISSLSSAKADPKIPVNIVGGGTTPPPPVATTQAVPPSPTAQKVKPTQPQPLQKQVWDYHASDKAYGPQNWHLLTPECAKLRQSPVDIVTANVVTRPGSLKFSVPSVDAATAQLLIVKGKLKNNGRAIGFTVDTAATPVKLSLLKTSYTLRQFHFHFGCEDEMGSEHSIDGQRFPGEIHFVFTNDSCKSTKEAMQQKGGLAAIAFFMQYDDAAENKAMKRISDNIKALRLPHGSVDFSADGISLANLIPAVKEGLANLKVFAYEGSLPTPPCFQSVIWFVYRRPVKVNPITLELWRNVLQGDYGRMCGNYRPAQKLNNRKIFSFSPSAAPTEPASVPPPVSTAPGPTGAPQPTVPVSGPSVAPAPSAGIRAPLSSLEKIGLGPGRKEKAFATLVHDSGRVPDETHLPADARQELHPEPVDANKQKSEGISKSQPLEPSLQGLNPAFAKIPSAKDNNALPEPKKGIETSQQQSFKPVGTILVRGAAKQVKRPTVAPGMKRQPGL